MEKRNVLVLENVSQLDEQFSVYLNTYHKDNNLDVVYGLANEYKPVDLIPHFSKADTLAVCSSFANRKQFCQIIDILEKFENITRIEIMYLYTKNDQAFVQFLVDFKSDYPDYFQKIQKLVETREVCEIYNTCYEIEKGFFSKLNFTYDVVQLYNVKNSKFDIIFPVRQPISYWDNKYYFRDHIQILVDKYEYFYEALNDSKSSHEIILELLKKNQKLKKIKSFDLTTSDVSNLKDLFVEITSILEDRNEKLDENKFFDEDDTKTLRKNNNTWLEVINKITDQL